MSFEYTSIYLDDPIVEGRALDVFEPGKARRELALFFVHGGGWRGGSRSGSHALMRAFNAEGFVCAATDYRLAGVHILDQLTDVRHGYDAFTGYLARHALPRQVAVFGSSAGAHLAALLALAVPGQCGESLRFHRKELENDWQSPVGAILSCGPVTFEPWEDIFPHIWISMQDIVGVPYADAPEAYRRVSPIEYVGSESPPCFMVCAENEHMFPFDQTMRFVEKMRSFGGIAEHKVYPRTEHGFLYDVVRRQQKEAFSDIIAFLQTLIGGDTERSSKASAV
ncbi:MAG TPA: alpha/beta hydrolase fold domain-containing protein [Candidatus Hydrogenedentes bacterium]|nr:alpha/beta hydrolase fold domain-containing protein [Candidatus Hydrogenedentota bacterium]